jgi:rod shape-determining protein MreD
MGKILILMRNVIIILLLLVIQFTFIPLISVKGIMPDLMLIILVHWSLKKSSTYGVIMGFVVGVLQDFAGAGMIGVFSLSKSISCYIVNLLKGNYFNTNLFYRGWVLFVATLVHHLITLLFVSHNSEAGFFVLFLRYSMPSIFVTVLTGVLGYKFFELLKRFQTKKIED